MTADSRAVGATEELDLPEMGQWALVWRRFSRHRLAYLGLIVLVFFVVLSFGAPWLAPYPYDKINMNDNYSLPSAKYFLGTDELGRDIFSRLLYAGRISISVALVSTLLSSLVGIIVGAAAAYWRGVTDMILMRLTDVMLSMPTLPLLLVFSKMLREYPTLKDTFGDYLSVFVLVTILTLFGWMYPARLVYSSVLSLRETEFTEAARALGSSGWRILFSHLIPNSMAPVIVISTLGFGQRVVLEATLSFLGLGVNPPVPSWGNMLSQAYAYMLRNPWLAVYPGLFIFFTVLAINFLGDALRDALDPRLKV
ncbi:MAG: ABC transporter permease [Chloroflexi bacterium]|nr:ABC transporter permease [Chloroflexota bacterium]MCL5110996.1 ABC transporter permease [Chloroflexota bacterium]